MSKLCGRRDLQEVIRSGDGVFVLFYATWCPFSLTFLPIYEKCARGRDREFVRITLEGNEDLFAEHLIEVYPTVLFFKDGAIVRRLDGKYLAGLKEKQLAELIASCDSGHE
jgi:thiol-disulfide isomerase/thioredoxin